MAIKTIMDSTLAAIADAIRAKTGRSASMTPLEMPTEIGSISGGGGMDPNLEALMKGAATGAITIRNITDLSGVRITLGRSSSENTITELHMPDLVYFGAKNVNGGLRGGGLIDMSGSGSTSSADLQVLDLPECTHLYLNNTENNNNYRNFSNLTTLNAPKLVYLYGKMRYCGVTTLNLPMLKTTPTFNNCTALTKAVLGIDSTDDVGLNANMFQNDTSLTEVQLKTANIPSNCFASTALSTLVLYNPSSAGVTITTLTSTAAFAGTPIAAGTGYIYVPRDKISEYEADTNWSTYAGQFRAIEDYTVNGEFVAPSA